MQALRREDKAHLRTRVPRDGMDYKGYNVAMHELGHNVEQVFSLNGIDHWSLAGIPNTACTEAFAFVFQHRDLEILGLGAPDEEAWRKETLAVLWNTYEIAGVSLVDMAVWNWMYQHPEATPAELRAAVLAIARDVWNRFFAPVFGVRDSDILAIYSHMIVYGLYLPDYAIGHILAFQIARKLRQGSFGAEVERIARQGGLTPDAWIRGAVGGPLSAEALLGEAREAIAAAEQEAFSLSQTGVMP
jgi:oligoendopeptidase F